jgi:hypothetical protein
VSGPFPTAAFRQRGRHIEHPLADRDELLPQQIAKPVGRLDRPQVIVELRRPGDQLIRLHRRRPDLYAPELDLIVIDCHRRVRPLMRIDTDHHRHQHNLPRTDD